MKFKDILKSPIFAQDHRWNFEKRKGYYESDVTALVRRMLEDERIAQDQRFRVGALARRRPPDQEPLAACAAVQLSRATWWVTASSTRSPPGLFSVVCDYCSPAAGVAHTGLRTQRLSPGRD
jgi:hypothetical protein